MVTFSEKVFMYMYCNWLLGYIQKYVVYGVESKPVVLA